MTKPLRYEEAYMRLALEQLAREVAAKLRDSPTLKQVLKRRRAPWERYRFLKT